MSKYLSCALLIVILIRLPLIEYSAELLNLTCILGYNFDCNSEKGYNNMLINIVVTVIILLAGSIFAILQYKKRNSKFFVAFSIAATIFLSITGNLFTNAIERVLPMQNMPDTGTYNDASEADTENIDYEKNDSPEIDGLGIADNQVPDTNHDIDSQKPDEDQSREDQSNDSKLGEQDKTNTDNADTVTSQDPNVTLGTSTISDTGDNDSSQYAQNFILGDTIEGSISLEGDIDFFKFSLIKSGQVSFDILSHIKYYTLVIYDMSGTEIWYTDNNEYNQTVGFREDTYSIDLISGDYFLKVTGYKYGTSYASTGDYRIETTFLSADANEVEPNNKADEANQISLGDTIRGLIGENDRFDFYKFTLVNSGRVCLDITSYMRYYTLILYDATGAEIWYSDNNEYNQTVKFRNDVYYLDLECGDFFLSVTGYKYGTSYASTGNYTISTSFISANANEAEPNNISGEANKVSLGNTLQGLIGINDRFDFYVFTLSKSEKVMFDITSYMRYYCLILYDSTGAQFWYTDNNQFNETSGFRTDLHEINLEKGTYYLCVTGYKYGNSYASTGNYTITINAK